MTAESNNPTGTTPPVHATETAHKAKPSEIKARLSVRNWIQLGIFVLTIAVGIQFFLYVHQASGTGAVPVERPPGVEGFLPIGALMCWKLFLTTGKWDPVHPAAMVILGFALLLSLVFRKSFCGWFCPVGTVSEWVWRMGKKVTGKNYKLPAWLDYPLRGLKYILLGFFLWAILSMGTRAAAAFIGGDYYKLSDVRMLHFFTEMSLLTAGVLAFLTAASFFVQNFWCRYLCPYGALLGLLASVGPTGIQRNKESCIECGQCAKTCPNRLPVDRRERIISPECSGCMECTSVCPRENTLAMKTLGVKKAWTTAALGMVVAGLFLGIVYTAKISGHWQSRVPQMEILMMLRNKNVPLPSHPEFR